MIHPSQWMEIRSEGLFCIPAGIYIDPVRPVTTAVITHGHADHARSGHQNVYAIKETIDIMQCRYGEACASAYHPLIYGETVPLSGGVTLRLVPAGHILGSAQAVLDYQGSRIVISGDYKRSPDPTCKPFEPVPCDVFITEATFGLPVFKHPPIEEEIQKLLDSLALFPDRCHLVGVYALGKCQRLILALRDAGYHKPLYLHGALVKLCELYERYGIRLGDWVKVSDIKNKKELAGEIVLAPPSALQDSWSRALPNVMAAMASGWMHIRARARQRGVELPLIISDHADWEQLLQTAQQVNAPEIWITHGREDALAYQLEKMGYCAKSLALLGYEDDEE